MNIYQPGTRLLVNTGKHMPGGLSWSGTYLVRLSLGTAHPRQSTLGDAIPEHFQGVILGSVGSPVSLLPYFGLQTPQNFSKSRMHITGHNCTGIHRRGSDRGKPSAISWLVKGLTGHDPANHRGAAQGKSWV